MCPLLAGLQLQLCCRCRHAHNGHNTPSCLDQPVSTYLRRTDVCCMRSFIDPFIGNREEKRLERRRRPSFDFIQQGRLQKQAEGQRLRVLPSLCCCSSW